MAISTDIAVIIPARYASSRFPGKPLQMVAGVPMIQRVWAIAQASSGVSRVIVATDDARIVDAVQNFGGEAVMTPSECRNGTERVHAALSAISNPPAIGINLQGDAVLTPPWVIGAVVEAFGDATVQMATPAVALSDVQVTALTIHKQENPASGTTVTIDKNGNALYFSKAIIPFQRQAGGATIHRHIGIYGYRRETLATLVDLPESNLEKSEGLEQLRALENGIPVRVVPVNYRGRSHWSIDSPGDVSAAEGLIVTEGELLTSYDGHGSIQS